MALWPPWVPISIHAPREGGDTLAHQVSGAWVLFQSTPPARGATTTPAALDKLVILHISIHAPREGGDAADTMSKFVPFGFQSTPPARGATRRFRRWWYRLKRFQSTPPARGATPRQRSDGCRTGYFNPRPPRGGRLGRRNCVHTCDLISIHAPREGGDRISGGRQHHRVISIHAPREGGDKVLQGG